MECLDIKIDEEIKYLSNKLNRKEKIIKNMIQQLLEDNYNIKQASNIIIYFYNIVI